jgi:DNA repair protein RadD
MTFAPIQVASVFTLARRLSTAPDFDFIIVDEAHHVTQSNTWGKVIQRYPEALLLGVTATPVRMDGRGLGNSFDTLVIGPSTKDLTDQGYLVPARVLAPPDQIDTRGLKTLRGDFDKPALAGRARTITGNVVDHYRKHCDGLLAIAFCVSRDHAAQAAFVFNQAGIPSEVLDGSLAEVDQAGAVARFKRRQTMVLFTVDLVSEGFDCPGIEAAILLRPTQSPGLYLQQVGRSLRLAPGKSQAIILDHAGNCFRHGLPAQERKWELTKDRIKMAKAIPLTTCGQCYAVAKKSARQCPVCQSPLSAPKEAKPRHISTRPGELIEISQLAEMPYKDAIRWARDEEKLTLVAKARGYHKNWVSNIIKARTRNAEAHA